MSAKERLLNRLQRCKTFAKKFAIEAIAIGNGTAGRETERFCKRHRFARRYYYRDGK
nr:hypothetical protein [Candidatus Kuenenia stuttgartiensis]